MAWSPRGSHTDPVNRHSSPSLSLACSGPLLLPISWGGEPRSSPQPQGPSAPSPTCEGLFLPFHFPPTTPPSLLPKSASRVPASGPLRVLCLCCNALTPDLLTAPFAIPFRSVLKCYLLCEQRPSLSLVLSTALRTPRNTILDFLPIRFLCCVPSRENVSSFFFFLKIYLFESKQSSVRTLMSVCWGEGQREREREKESPSRLPAEHGARCRA